MTLNALNELALEVTLPVALLPLRSTQRLTLEEYYALCARSPEILSEREPDGTIIITSPVGLISGRREGRIIARLVIHAETNPGEAFSSSTGFTLPDGSVRSPDASYLSAEKLAPLSEEELKKMAAVVPDFVVEVMSDTDRHKEAATKMREKWMANGVRLGWLIDVDNDRMWIYRADGTIEFINALDHVITGEDAVPGFEFDLRLLT